MESGLFNFFSILMLISIFLVITVKNSIYSVLFLILSFVSSSLLLFFLECDFLAFLFVLIYVGAITILFLFAVMMLESKLKNLLKNKIKYMPVGLIFSVCLFYPLFYTGFSFSNFSSSFFYLNIYQN